MIKSKSYKNCKFTNNYQSYRIFAIFNRIFYKSKHVYQNDYQNLRLNKKLLKVIIKIDEKFKLKNRDFEKHKNLEFERNNKTYNDNRKNKTIDR